ncbi:lipopolysaccharide biosynthesis protein [Xylophilus sp.]|uniref:lipopolysaccharide biosynthesis protein n=1 Tax=Xylophilus sp. TaxID=2653893 RepID=UPI0013BB59A8|nr:hypothetical protein [Xylophilus sp.]KAF1045985.1 MAG: hypothetical protein GAK38_02688 [Xylophilus sp.]
MAAEPLNPAASGRRRLLADSVAALADQALLSALNLALGLLLIRLTTKESYGLYAQLVVGGLFAATVLESLVTGPLTNVAAGLDAQRRGVVVAHLARHQGRLALGLALLGGVAVALAVAWTGTDPWPVWLGTAFSVYVYTGSLREYVRSTGFLDGRARDVLRMDALYALATAAAVGLLAAAGRLELPAVVLALGLANLAALAVRRLPAADRSDRSDRAGHAAAVAAVWQRGRWALPGALVAWATNYSYLFLAALWLGAAASADLNASRLLLMPISLCVVAWARIARPHAARLLAERQPARLERYALASVAALELLTLAYVAVLWLALPWLEARVLGPKYAGLGTLVLAWGAYFAVYTVRWIGSALLSSGDRYRMLLASGMFCLVAMLAAAAWAIPRWGVWGAVAALALVEGLDLLLIWGVLLPRVRRAHAETAR